MFQFTRDISKIYESHVRCIISEDAIKKIDTLLVKRGFISVTAFRD